MTLIDHVSVSVADLEASARFYRAVLAALGVTLDHDGPDYFSAGEFYVDPGGSASGPIHLAFKAADRAAVARFHEAGLAAGGRDNGGPGERHYHPGYYAAFLFDPDGNNVEAVHHGDVGSDPDAIGPEDEVGP